MTAHALSSANPKSVRGGVVQTGGTNSSQPLPNVHVTLFEATPALPTTVGQATTDTVGRFTISYKKSKSSSIFFLKADIGEGVEFVTILGSDLPQSTTINELTTVAASYSMAQFYRTGVILGKIVWPPDRRRDERQHRRVRDRAIVAGAIELAECR